MHRLELRIPPLVLVAFAAIVAASVWMPLVRVPVPGQAWPWLVAAARWRRVLRSDRFRGARPAAALAHCHGPVRR